MREMAEAARAMEERNGTKRDRVARLLNGWRSLLISVSLLEGKAKLVFKAQAKRERGPIRRRGAAKAAWSTA